MYQAEWPVRASVRSMYLADWPERASVSSMYLAEWPVRASVRSVYLADWPERASVSSMYLAEWPVWTSVRSMFLAVWPVRASVTYVYLAEWPVQASVTLCTWLWSHDEPHAACVLAVRLGPARGRDDTLLGRVHPATTPWQQDLNSDLGHYDAPLLYTPLYAKQQWKTSVDWNRPTY